MQQALFNFNDIALLLIIVECFLLSSILLSTPKGKRTSNCLLAAFIITTGLGTLDTLLYWCAPLKTAYFSDTYQVFFVLKFTPFLLGPLLYWYVCSVIYTDFTIQKTFVWHLIPVALYPIIIMLIWRDLGAERLMNGIYDYDEYFNNVFFRATLIAQQASILFYTIMSAQELIRYRQRLQQTVARLGPMSRQWLKALLIAYLSLWVWSQGKQIANDYEWETTASLLGLTGNYLLLIFVNLLVIMSLIQVNIGRGVKSEDASQSDSLAEPPSDHIARFGKLMEEDKPFLDPEITLEKLSGMVNLTPRQISLVINRHHQVNFYDYINRCRIEVAKEILTSSGRITISDVMARAGFNSKSSFYRLFKQYNGLTPSEYKKQ